MASSCSSALVAGRSRPPVGIKELVDSGVLHVPAQYIMPVHQRIGAAPILEDGQNMIPVIDLTRLLEQGGHDQGRAEVVQQIGTACEEWGFFQVIHHGVPPRVIESMRAASQRFFDLPAGERMQLHRQDLESAVDYSLSFNPLLPQAWGWNETVNFRRIPNRSLDGFRDAPEIFREALQEYVREIEKLGDAIYRAVFESLGVSVEDCLRTTELPPNPRVIVAVNYYPPCPDPSLTLGTPAHSDISSLTILEPDHHAQLGLHVYKGDAWVAVKPVANSFVVNVGDQIEILSNGRYKSVEHRAVSNPEKSRMSIACFLGPSENAIIAPLSELVNHNNPARFSDTLFGDYVNNFYNTKLKPKRGTLDFARVSSPPPVEA